MNIFAFFASEIHKIITENQKEWELANITNLSRITVEPPRDINHGDMATNAALILAKPNNQNPRDLGQKLADKLQALDMVEEVEIAGPGFVNLRISNHFWQQAVLTILSQGCDFGRHKAKGEMINVEYVSVNPTGPLHVGHSRGAVVGDAIAEILKFVGYDVIKEYYINDAGAQVDILARSSYLRYKEALGQGEAEIPEGLYPGEYLIPVGQALAEKYGDKFMNADEDEYLHIFRDFSVEAMMKLIKNQLDELGVYQDVFTSERRLVEGGKLEEAIEYLRDKNIVYEGVLPKPKGKEDDEWKPVELTLFRSSCYGDDVDRPLFKSDGSHTYFASDIAYHFDKYQRGAARQIDIWGADHAGYVKRMQAGVKAMSEGKADLKVKLCQIVNFTKNGSPVRMSKRAGNFITTSDVVKAVGKDVVRFIMLTRSADTQFDFDFNKVVEMSKDNPVFYVQYAHARICSVKKQIVEILGDVELSDEALQKAQIDRMTDEGELNIIRHMLKWPLIVEMAAENYEPHRIANYLYELSGLIHSQWNKGNEDTSLRFVSPDDVELTIARFALLRAVQIVIAIGLMLFGVNAKESM